MKILVSNDDGYLAPGIAALAEAMAGIADITVVAPESNRSGSSNSLTLDRPLRVYRAQNGFYSVNGTPSDCVHIALTGILDHRPDLDLLRAPDRTCGEARALFPPERSMPWPHRMLRHQAAARCGDRDR